MDVMCRFGLGIPITSAKSAFKERYCCSVCIVQYIFLCDCCGFLFFQNELDCADTGVFVYSETYSSPVKPLRSSLQWILLINKIVNIWNIEHHDIIFLHGSGVGTFSIFFFISCMLCCMFFFFCLRGNLLDWIGNHLKRALSWLSAESKVVSETLCSVWTVSHVFTQCYLYQHFYNKYLNSHCLVIIFTLM